MKNHSFSKSARQRVRALLAAGLVLGLVGCGGGGTGADPSAFASSNKTVAAAVRPSAPLASCPNGGITVDTGIDSNGNGLLDTAEAHNHQYVCHGAPGSTEPDDTTGGTGAAGSNGANALVRMLSESAGSNCASGGTKVDAGLDANANNTLDASEVASTSYVCNGATGAAGATGSAGATGAAGAAGATGSNGLSNLIAIVAEAAGANCSYGGNKISSGLDSNGDGVLDTSEISATNYVCNGAPGATGPAGPGVTWVDVTNATVKAQANTGYLADNANAQVVVTLPATASLSKGDVVAVSGLGAGGWKIAQRADQSINTKNLGTSGVNWTARDSARAWHSVASSADGNKLVAVAVVEGGGQIYTSTDSGVSWTARDSARSWWSVASSADGSKLVAVTYGGQIYTSSDSGLSWTARDSARQWYSVASSANGSKLVAVLAYGQIYTSTDSGLSWTARDSNRIWNSVASSADGNKLVAGMRGGQIYTSTDSGLNWTARGSVRYWISVASSADGSKLVAVAVNGQIYTSTDSGLSWTARDSVRQWQSVASSADGNKLVAVESSGQIYTSTDSGLNWTPRDSIRGWNSVASSADGSKLVAGVNGGQIYTSTTWSTLGNTGSISGTATDAIQLQYQGNGNFGVISFAGSFSVQ